MLWTLLLLGMDPVQQGIGSFLERAGSWTVAGSRPGGPSHAGGKALPGRIALISGERIHREYFIQLPSQARACASRQPLKKRIGVQRPPGVSRRDASQVGKWVGWRSDWSTARYPSPFSSVKFLRTTGVPELGPKPRPLLTAPARSSSLAPMSCASSKLAGPSCFFRERHGVKCRKPRQV